MKQRGGHIYIGFIHFLNDDSRHRKSYSNLITVEYTAIRAVEFGSPVVHSDVFFGDHVARLIVTDKGIDMVQSPPEDRDVWEMVSLPFTDPHKALEIGVETLKRSYTQDNAMFMKPIAVFNYHPWEMMEYFLRRLAANRNPNDFHRHDDYNEERPDEWVRGLHCSQFVLLFLKRCVNAGVLPIHNKEHKERFLKLHTFTCLPSALRVIVKEIWQEQAVSEFRDYIVEPKCWEKEQLKM